MNLKLNNKALILSLLCGIGITAYAEYKSFIFPSTASYQIGDIPLDPNNPNPNPSSNLPVGVIMIWGQGSLPSGWVELDGGSTSGYPNLAAIYGGNVPDFRGRFVRALDGGAGVDSEPGRAVLSTQEDAIRNITGSVRSAMRGGAGGTLSAGGAFTEGPSGTTVPDHYNRSSSNYNGFNFDASLQVPTAFENRVKNIAARYIIKAE